MAVRHRVFAVVGTLAFLLLCAAPSASAHVRDTIGYSTITAGPDNSVSYRLSLEYELLAKVTALGDDALNAGTDTDRAAHLRRGSDAVGGYLDERVVLYLDDVACEPELTATAIQRRDDKAYATLDLAYHCPGAAGGGYRLDYQVFVPEDAVADGHTNVVEYTLGGDTGSTVLDDSHRSFSTGDTSVVSAGLRFGLLGIEHILFGLDHVLFVIALVLGATSLRNLIGVASMFTAAHSVTLVLASLGWVSVPAAIVEPLIALSIAFVAVENLLGGSKHRLPVVFAFGLLHGLGFAGSLRISDEFSWNLLASLLSFNIGIELGQALLLAVAFPVVLLARRYRWSLHTLVGATAVVAAFGLFWFVERVTLA